jgi:uncharacterized OsmC-like protein
MNSDELRALQGPIKAKYREDPSAGVTLRSVAVNRDIAVTDGRVIAEGDLDFRGTLGVDRDVPVGFRAIRLRFELQSPASAEDIETLLALTERYCVVYQSLTHGVPISFSHTTGVESQA